MVKIKPFLKWAGRKYSILDTILPVLPPANRFIEPFMGSGAVFINTDYPHYLLGEANEDLIKLFQVLQHDGEDFISYCEQFFCPFNNNAIQYYQLREQFNQCVDSKQRAAIFLYLNRHGYNGLCRYNQKGIYNVPFGRYKNPYFPHEEMSAFYRKSQEATFIHCDFRASFALAQPGDVIYCDPPYAPLFQKTNFSSYTDTKFGEEEQILLAKLAMNASASGIPVVISNHDTDFTRYHYRHSKIQSFPVKRSINCDANKRFLVNELLAVFR